MEYQQITVEDRDAIRLITLTRPDKLNAWTQTMRADLERAFTSGTTTGRSGRSW